MNEPHKSITNAPQNGFLRGCFIYLSGFNLLVYPVSGMNTEDPSVDQCSFFIRRKSPAAAKAVPVKSSGVSPMLAAVSWLVPDVGSFFSVPF